MTYTNKERLERKTGTAGQGRFHYLQSLVTEFQDTHRKASTFFLLLFLTLLLGSLLKSDYKLQVLANLANFAYDPINYEFFRQLNVLDLFLDVMAEETDTKMIEFAIGGICNCCLDKQNQSFLLGSDCIDLTIKCLSSSNEETVLSAITTLIYLITPTSKNVIVNEAVKQLMRQFSESPKTRLSNLAKIFLQDYCLLR